MAANVAAVTELWKHSDLPYQARRAVALAEPEIFGEAAAIQKKTVEIRRLLAVQSRYLGERD